MFKILFKNNKDSKWVYFNTYDTEIAKKWYEELINYNEIDESTRFTDWPGQKKNYVKLINEQIGIINAYDRVIDIRATDKTNLNYLHTYFENLRGEITIGTDWFNNAPDNIQEALKKFNILIHEYESQKRGNAATVVVTFKNRPRRKLEDYNDFTFKWRFGEVYINYCHVGKNMLDIFKDNDEYTIDEPQTHYSSDVMIKFGKNVNWLMHVLRKLQINRWLKEKGLTFKKNSFGMIPVAKIDLEASELNHKSYKDIVRTLSVYDKIGTVRCLE
jgi:hypothetical protein|tara:strand:- start:70 stop:888 length:819 start_codon:yes stop_codon:yes gene_type:complete